MPVTAPLQQEILLSWLLLSVSVVVSRRCAFEAESSDDRKIKSVFAVTNGYPLSLAFVTAFNKYSLPGA